MRALKIVLIVIVVVGVLAVVADLIAVRLAESEAAGRIRTEYDLSKEPEIDIKGFPFLTQVAGKEFEHVEVGLSGIDAVGAGGRTLRIDDVRADLRGVRVRGSGWDAATADRAEGEVRITYEDLSAALPLVKIGYGGEDAAGGDQVEATVGAGFMGQQIEETVRGKITVENGDTVRLRATGLENLEGVPGVEEFVREQVDYEWRLEELPPGVELEDVEVSEDGITITGSGADVDLGGPASTG